MRVPTYKRFAPVINLSVVADTFCCYNVRKYCIVLFSPLKHFIRIRCALRNVALCCITTGTMQYSSFVGVIKICTWYKGDLLSFACVQSYVYKRHKFASFYTVYFYLLELLSRVYNTQ